jgi:tetratricopeptide (TPR) repeat protein
VRPIATTIMRWMPPRVKRVLPARWRNRVRRWMSSSASVKKADPLVLAKREATLAARAGDWESAARLWTTVIATSQRPSGKAFALLARAQRKSGDTDAATATVARGLMSFPSHKRLRIEEAEVAMARHEWPAASQLWTALDMAELSPSPRLYARMAKAHRRAGDLLAASNAVARGQEQHSDDSRLALEAAELAAAERDWDQAITRWRAIINSGDAMVGAYLKLAEAHSELGHFSAAKATVGEGLSRYPADPSLETELIAIAVREVGWEAAQPLWNEIVQRAACTVPVSRRVKLAKHCLAAAEYRGADVVIEEGLRHDPDELRLQLQYVRNAVAEERRTEDPSGWQMRRALERCTQLLVASPDKASEELVLDLANELSDATALTEACELLRHGFNENPGSLRLLDELATLLMASGKWKEATACLTELPIGISSEGRTRHAVRASRAHRATEDYERAVSAIMGHAETAYPLDLPLIVELMQIDVERGEYGAAATRAKEIIDNYPEVPISIVRQCVCACISAGQLIDARHIMLLASRRHPGQLEANPGVVAIIGGGTSLQGVDLTPLRRVAHCVGVNATSRALPWVDVTVTHDTSHLAERVRESPGRVIAGVPRDHLKQRGLLDGVEYRRRLVAQRLSESDELLHSGGHTSAYTALNYAFLLRPRRIVLFGIDLVDFWGPDDSWHKQMDPYNRRRYEMLERRPTFEQFRDYRNKKLRHADSVFATALPQLERCDVEVVNASPVSSIQCFEKVTPEEGIRRCISVE